MAKSYKTSDNDRLDMIVFREYGSLDMLNLVLEYNPKLHDMDVLIPYNTDIYLPDKVDNIKLEVVKEDDLLW